jgi:hypothetical protein
MQKRKEKAVNKYLPHILITAFVILFVQGFFKGPEGMSEEEHLYKVKIHDLNQEKIESMKAIEELQKKNQIYENFYDSLEADNSLDTATANELRSKLSDYAKSRR